MVEDEGENFGAAIERNWGGEGNPSVRCGCGAASEEGTEETHREKKTEVSAQWSGQSEKLRVFRVLEETGRLYCTISQA